MLNNKNMQKYLTILNNFIDGVIAIEIPEEKNSFKTDEIAKVCESINLNCIKKKDIKEANKYLFFHDTTMP